jgi:hypothetical protein
VLGGSCLGLVRSDGGAGQVICGAGVVRSDAGACGGGLEWC